MGAAGTLVVRLMSSPGSGKTSLLEATLPFLTGPQRPQGACVLVGDIETDRDARRLQPFAPSLQITTGGACHLEIPLVERAWEQLARQLCPAGADATRRPGFSEATALGEATASRPDSAPDFLFIEDVGNLICPASHDLGEHLRIILLSVTEGDDKPGKYPKAFRTSDVVVLTKTDLLPYVPFSLTRAREDAQRVNAQLRFFEVSAWRLAGLAAWIEFLEAQRAQLLATRRAPS